jgi:choline-sulfatase
MNVQRAVIHEGWKLIIYPEAKATRLYHLENDPQELKDLAAEPAMLERKKALFAKLQSLQKELHDELDIASVFPELK